MKLFVFLTLFLCGFTTVKNNSNQDKFIVVLDPGHGGRDSGTLTKTKIKEKDINLYVAEFIKLNIEEFSDNIEVVLTREKDVFLPLERRPIYARVLNADLFISIHCNHNPKSTAEGLEIYIQKTGVKNKRNVKKAQYFSQLIDEISLKDLNYKSRGIVYEDFSVLRNSINHLPSVLIELGYFSNKKEADYITSKKGINGLSLVITKSILKYFE